MDRFTHFGLRGDGDEQLRRAIRDGFKRVGLSHAQMQQAMEWYMDDVRPGMDEAKMMESFTEFAAAKAWPVEQRDAAMMVYGRVHDGDLDEYLIGLILQHQGRRRHDQKPMVCGCACGRATARLRSSSLGSHPRNRACRCPRRNGAGSRRRL
jgi:hypothetical protein